MTPMTTALKNIEVANAAPSKSAMRTLSKGAKLSCRFAVSCFTGMMYGSFGYCTLWFIIN